MNIEEFNKVKFEVESFIDSINEAMNLATAFKLLSEFYLRLTDSTSYKQYLELSNICNEIAKDLHETKDL